MIGGRQNDDRHGEWNSAYSYRKPTFNHTAMKISETMCLSVGLFVHFKIQDLNV